MLQEPPDTQVWVHGVLGGDREALARLLEYYRSRLRQMVALWMDPLVRARVDPSDVVQEVYLDASRQIQSYLREPKVVFYVWLRGLAQQRLWKVHRRHLKARCRTSRREEPLPTESSALLVSRLLAGQSSPSRALSREDLRQCMRRALEKLSASDHEIILMRHFEELSNQEVAQVLGLSESGATMRYGRALFRLKEILLADPEFGGPRR